MCTWDSKNVSFNEVNMVTKCEIVTKTLSDAVNCVLFNCSTPKFYLLTWKVICSTKGCYQFHWRSTAQNNMPKKNWTSWKERNNCDIDVQLYNSSGALATPSTNWTWKRNRPLKRLIWLSKLSRKVRKVRGVTIKKRDCSCYANHWLPIGKPVRSTIASHLTIIILQYYAIICFSVYLTAVCVAHKITLCQIS